MIVWLKGESDKGKHVLNDYSVQAIVLATFHLLTQCSSQYQNHDLKTTHSHQKGYQIITPAMY